jgi:superfamily II DNA/RNA helicase
VRTKRGADRLVKRLAAEGIAAAAMHGNKSQGQRERALARFGDRSVDVLVATDVAARGIDVEGISHVINFDPPADRDGYVHRVGRTGRAGRRGVGVTLVKREESRDVGAIARNLRLEREFAEIGAFASPATHERPATSGTRGGDPPHARRRRAQRGSRR